MNHTQAIERLAEVSRMYGKDKNYIIGSQGNTSYKTEQEIYVKPSGKPLSNTEAADFVGLHRNQLTSLLAKTFSDDSSTREKELTSELMKCRIDTDQQQRPSVETFLHHLIEYQFIVHTHHWFVNSLLASTASDEYIFNLLGKDVLIVPYSDPGYTLFKLAEKCMQQYLLTHSSPPHIVLLRNHGIFVAAESLEKIQEIYQIILSKLSPIIQLETEKVFTRNFNSQSSVVQEIRKLESYKYLTSFHYHSSLTEEFSISFVKFSEVALPIIPDTIAYCGYPLYINEITDVFHKFETLMSNHEELFHTKPKLFIIKDFGMVSFGNSAYECEFVNDIFLSGMKIYKQTQNFGKPAYLSADVSTIVQNKELQAYANRNHYL